MGKRPLDNLVRIGELNEQPPDQGEFDGLLRSGRARLRDAENRSLSIESRFDLDEALVEAVIRVTHTVLEGVEGLGPVKE